MNYLAENSDWNFHMEAEEAAEMRKLAVNEKNPKRTPLALFAIRRVIGQMNVLKVMEQALDKENAFCAAVRAIKWKTVPRKEAFQGQDQDLQKAEVEADPRKEEEVDQEVIAEIAEKRRDQEESPEIDQETEQEIEITQEIKSIRENLEAIQNQKAEADLNHMIKMQHNQNL